MIPPSTRVWPPWDIFKVSLQTGKWTDAAVQRSKSLSDHHWAAGHS